MAITPEQLEKRRKYLCSSDSPQILMVDPWGGPYDVWMSKKHALDDLEGEQLELGNELESVLVPWAARRWGLKEYDSKPEVIRGIFCDHADGLNVDAAISIEGKSVAYPKKEEWGDEMTDEVPERVIIQCHHHMLVGETEVTLVPVIAGFWGKPGLSRRLYVVRRNEALIDYVREQGEEWWERYVVGDEPPDNVRPSFETIARIPRESGKVVDVPADVVRNWIKAADSARGAYREADEIKADIQAAMGDAEVADFGDPEWVCTYREQVQRRIDSTLLKRDYPEVAKAVTKEVKFRKFMKQKRKNVIEDC